MNNTQLHHSWVEEEITKEIKVLLEFNENVDTTYPNLWDDQWFYIRDYMGRFSSGIT